MRDEVLPDASVRVDLYDEYGALGAVRVPRKILLWYAKIFLDAGIRE